MPEKNHESAAGTPANNHGEMLSEEDLAYVTGHLSDDQLDNVSGGSEPNSRCEDTLLGEVGECLDTPFGEAG